VTHLDLRRARPDDGFTLTESLIAMVLMLVITGTVFGLVNNNTLTTQAQPEAMDMQQRARIAGDMLSRDLFMAGAGVCAGPQTGALNNFFAAIRCRRRRPSSRSSRIRTARSTTSCAGSRKA
jgi:prepilin-type N-terminal cleavage/methylation domain-containing protein